MKLLEGKTAVITGAARGIGKALALRFAAEGANIAFTDLVIDENGKQTEQEIAALGVKCKGYASNAADFAQTEVVIAEIMKDFGRIDILVNNAGVGGTPVNMLEQTEETFDHVMDADLKALYFLSQLAGNQMKAQGREGEENPYRIINMASAAGIKAPRGDTIYGAAKAAVIHLTKIMANEFARYGITVNAIAPGYVVTDMTKGVMADEKNANAVKKMIALRRYAQPTEIAGVANFLASDAGGYITGVLVPVDGGMTIN